MLTEDNLYILGQLENIDMSGLENSFAALPQDEYVEDRLRSRKYSRYLFGRDSSLRELDPQDFMQTSKINKALGDVERQYDTIDPNLLEDDAYLKLFEEFCRLSSLEQDCEIEAHQIRWHCKKRIKEPAPEGVHQDGFDYIGVFMINPHNVDGGEFMIYEDPQDAPCFKKSLEKGEFIVMNDKKLFHNASPLVPTANPEDGHWDVIVLTAHKNH